MEKQNAVGCLSRDTDAYTIAATRCQYLQRFGVALNWTGLIAHLAFGEASNA
jgi:hypothetical protein